MNAPPETPEVEVIKRFLIRFADLMSTGSNSENLLRAAQLLEANIKRADDAEQELLKERAKCTDLEAQLAALSRDDHVHIPVAVLRLAASQFESLAAAFEKSGDIVSQAMCSASASTLDRALQGKTLHVIPPPLPAAEANRQAIA